MKKRIDKEHKRTIGILLIGIIVISGLIIVSNKTFTGKAFYSQDKNSFERPITKENIIEVLKSHEILNDIPLNSLIQLQLFSIVNNEWVIDENYLLTKGDIIRKKIDNPEVLIMLNSKYLDGKSDLCTIIKNSDINNELYIDYKITEAGLLMKYSRLFKYKKCLA